MGRLAHDTDRSRELRSRTMKETTMNTETTTTDDGPVTPAEIIETHGLDFTWAAQGPSRITQGVRYHVYIEAGDACRSFTYHSSGHDEANGRHSDENMLGCLLSEAAYVGGGWPPSPAELADELHDEGICEGMKPSEAIELARNLVDNHYKLADLLGEDALLGYLARGIDW